MPDPIFAHPRLAGIYDDLDAHRRDLDRYEAIVDEFAAHSVLDLGCGTGTFACRLAANGLDVTAVDPAAASLAVARRKRHAERVRWLLGDATTLPPLDVDIVTMTGNVAQVMLTDAAWLATLRAVRDCLAVAGRVVFETRDPAVRDWERWIRETSITTTATSRGRVESWVQLTDVDLPLVTFEWTYRFLDDGAVLTSSSTLRFRSREEIDATLAAADLTTHEVRDAPDRPGKEFVFVAGPAT